MIPIVLHTANLATASATWSPNGVVSGLRGNDLLLEGRQQQLRFGLGQPQIGDLNQIIGPIDRHDVDGLFLTLGPGFHQPVDRHRLLSDVTRVLADEKVNILSASVTTSGDRVAISRFTFEMGDPKHLGHLLNVVRNVEGVYDVYRITSAS